MKTWLIVLAIIGIFIIAIVIVVDPVAENIINRRLNQAKTVRGSVGDVDVKLWDAAIHVANVEIYQRESKSDSPFISADEVIVDLLWKPLLQKTFVGDVYLRNAEYNYEMKPEKSSEDQRSGRLPTPSILLASTASSDSSSSTDGSSKLPPFTIDNLQVEQGTLHYRDPTTNPPITATISELQIDGKNISNQHKTSNQYPASLQAKGITTGDGQLELSMKMDLLPDRPEFESDLSISNISLPELNDFFKAYAGIGMNEGQLDVSSVLEVKEGSIDGFIHPDLQNIKVVEFGEGANAGEGLFNKSWELLAGLGLQIIHNQGAGKGESMGRIPIHQKFSEQEKNQNKSVFESIGQAISEAFDQEIQKQEQQRQQQQSSAQ